MDHSNCNVEARLSSLSCRTIEELTARMLFVPGLLSIRPSLSQKSIAVLHFSTPDTAAYFLQNNLNGHRWAAPFNMFKAFTNRQHGLKIWTLIFPHFDFRDRLNLSLVLSLDANTLIHDQVGVCYPHAPRGGSKVEFHTLRSIPKASCKRTMRTNVKKIQCLPSNGFPTILFKNDVPYHQLARTLFTIELFHHPNIRRLDFHGVDLLTPDMVAFVIEQVPTCTFYSVIECPGFSPVDHVSLLQKFGRKNDEDTWILKGRYIDYCPSYALYRKADLPQWMERSHMFWATMLTTSLHVYTEHAVYLLDPGSKFFEFFAEQTSTTATRNRVIAAMVVMLEAAKATSFEQTCIPANDDRLTAELEWIDGQAYRNNYHLAVGAFVMAVNESFGSKRPLATTRFSAKEWHVCHEHGPVLGVQVCERLAKGTYWCLCCDVQRVLWDFLDLDDSCMDYRFSESAFKEVARQVTDARDDQRLLDRFQVELRGQILFKPTMLTCFQIVTLVNRPWNPNRIILGTPDSDTSSSIPSAASQEFHLSYLDESDEDGGDGPDDGLDLINFDAIDLGEGEGHNAQYAQYAAELTIPDHTLAGDAFEEDESCLSRLASTFATLKPTIAGAATTS